jgi:hypothetical protein
LWTAEYFLGLASATSRFSIAPNTSRREESMSYKRILIGLAIAAAVGAVSAPSKAGSIFVSGEDPDFHDQEGPNTVGATNIIEQGLAFARDGNTAPILFVYTDPAPNNALGDHVDSQPGLITAGYTAGTTAGNHYVIVDATDFATVDLSNYSAIFVPSDHGGSLMEGDIAALDARSADIIDYLNAGGGLFALAEDGDHAGGNSAKRFGFLPFLVSSTAFEASETGNTLTAAGLALGLTNSDINGNFSHNIFTGTGGMTVVATNPNGDILGLDFRGRIGPSGVVPEPSTWAMLLLGFLGLGFAGYRRGALARAKTA